MKINTKNEMYELYNSGAFGNRIKTWPSLKVFLASDFRGEFSLRYRGSLPGGLGLYNVTRDDVEEQLTQVAREKNIDLSLVTVNESAPDERLVIQGEVQRGLTFPGLDLTYSTAKAKMRVGMANPSYSQGLAANLLLQKHMTADDYADLHLLLDTYEDAVVEFSTYEMELGDCPNRKTVFWEVRCGY